MDEINIEDIQDFSILKDASATAIYGSKGANSFVLINTKHGKSGKNQDRQRHKPPTTCALLHLNLKAGFRMQTY